MNDNRLAQEPSRNGHAAHPPAPDVTPPVVRAEPPNETAGSDGSPIARPPEPHAYELKFLVDEATAGAAEAWARQHLAPDPHADTTSAGYRTASLYLDTVAFDVYRRTGRFGRSKFRVRRYGAEPFVFLERKTRNGDRVAKDRARTPADEVELLGAAVPASWPGRWFGLQVAEGGLRPMCLVRYDRSAYVAETADGPLRLTLDRQVRGAPANVWSVEGPEGVPLLEGKVVLELKFRSAPPTPFKLLVEDLRLQPSAVSKYRLCVGAWGLDASAKDAAHA